MSVRESTIMLSRLKYIPWSRREWFDACRTSIILEQSMFDIILHIKQFLGFQADQASLRKFFPSLVS